MKPDRVLSPRRTVLVALVAVTALAPSGCAPVDDETGQIDQFITQCPSGTVLNGLDVSNVNGAITWSSVHGAGYAFTFMKATQGTGYTDPRFAANWSGARSAGVVRGAYHFFDPTVDGAAQARHYLAVLGTLGPNDLPPMLDLECPDGDSSCLGYAGGSGAASASTIRTNMMAWLNAVQAATGRTPVIYTFGSYLSSNHIDTTGLDRYGLFIANINPGSCFTIPSPWTHAPFRQYTWTGRVPGISGDVDLDHFYGTMADLTAFAGGADWGAQFVSQSFPYSSAGSVSIPAGGTHSVSITLKNIGTHAWDSNTCLGTTVPRDRASPLAGSEWRAPNRPACVPAGTTVAPGANHTFTWTMHAPAMPGRFDEHWGVLEEGVHWFSDPGEAGPPDDQLEGIFVVTASDGGVVATDAGGTDDAGGMDDAGAVGDDAGDDAGTVGGDDAGPTDDAGTVVEDAAEDAHDAASGHDGAAHDGGMGGSMAGCGCSVPGSRGAGGGARWVLLGAAAVVVAGGRRRRVPR